MPTFRVMLRRVGFFAYFAAPFSSAIFFVDRKFQMVSLALRALLVLPTSFSLMYCSPPGQVLPPSLTA
jgi:hypothetical protein